MLAALAVMIMERGSFRGDEIIVHRLSAGEEGDLGIGAGGGENIQCALCLFLRDVLAIVNGNELGVLLGVGLGQTLQEGGEVLIGAEELVLAQGQVIPLLDVKPSKSEFRAA